MAFFFASAIFLLLSDRLFKIFALNYLSRDINLIGEIFKLNFVKNYGIAFSLPLTGTLAIVVILLIILFLIWELIKLYQAGKISYAAVLGIIVGGAASNLWDRARYGFVIDYFDLKYFTVFNLADVMISGGVLLFFLLGLISRQKIQAD